MPTVQQQQQNLKKTKNVVQELGYLDIHMHGYGTSFSAY